MLFENTLFENVLFDKSQLQKILASYKAIFISQQWPNEKYKWIAVKHFKDNWNIDSPDFAEMIRQALAKTDNLLVSAGRFPGKMIEEFAEVAPEQVRTMFRELFDETKDLWLRVKSFKDNSQPLLDIHGKNAKNHYQDENVIFTYLWLKYPEKYFIYKISSIKKVAEVLHSNLVFKSGMYNENINNFLKLYNAIRQELLKDDELKALLKSQLTDDCYADDNLCTLTMDFSHYIRRTYNPENEENENWFAADYTPGFSVEDWLKLLTNSEIVTEAELDVLQCMYKIGGQATCSQLAAKFGQSWQHYNNNSSALGKRIIKYTNCPEPQREDGSTPYWAILYIGKKAAKEVLGSYLWKLRPELAEALKQIDLSGVNLYENDEPIIWKISHGPDDISAEEFSIFENKHLAVVHGLTKAKGKENESQGEKFIYKIKKGDFVYLCRGNSIRFFGQFDSDEAVINPEKQNDWYQRSYKLIATSQNTEPYTGKQKWWTSNHNSTCCKVDNNSDFEEKILKPYFDLTLADLKPHGEEMPDPMITELKDLLLSSKQLILTGAPGTGKTYLAKQVARLITGDTVETPESQSHIKFVQFHPSFDYTDFVEGLRPVDKGNGNIGFERKDGIFKSFCKKALKNYLDSQKSKQVIEAESSAQEKIDAFLNEAVEKQIRLKTTNGNEFFIREFDDRRVYIEIPGNEIKKDLIVPYAEVQKIISENLKLTKAGDIKNIFDRTNNRQHDSYVYVICNEIRQQKNIDSVIGKDKVSCENFVFIIDEINRGDISKIFGELFYAVDPGYRGEVGKVTTQYHNLIDETDLYYGGFYIPKNVYIIGTMNDIDRSVESMDFAIRRRFTWKEIEAKDAAGMWDNEIPEYKKKAFAVMTRLNAAIEQTESLSKAFHIGPAYFLKLKEYNGEFKKLWDLHIMPLLKEYLRGIFDAEKDLENLKAAYFGPADSVIEE